MPLVILSLSRSFTVFLVIVTFYLSHVAGAVWHRSFK